MRFFHYISESKLEMLASQLGNTVERTLKAELGVDSGVKATIGTETKHRENRIDQVKAVEAHLRKIGAIGTIDEPKQWFEGKALAIFARVREDRDAVFYFLRTENTYVALGGSGSNMISAKPQRTESFRVSYAPDLLDSLRLLITHPAPFKGDDAAVANFLQSGVAGDDRPWTGMIYDQCHYRRNGTFSLPIKFLARRLDADGRNGKRVILGSPLYVEDP